jgi:hypothetical protein
MATIIARKYFFRKLDNGVYIHHELYKSHSSPIRRKMLSWESNMYTLSFMCTYSKDIYTSWEVKYISNNNLCQFNSFSCYFTS